MPARDRWMWFAAPQALRPVFRCVTRFLLVGASAALLHFAGACAAPDRAASQPIASRQAAGAETSVSAASSAPAAQALDVPRGNAELLDYIAEQPLLLAEPGYRAAHIVWSGEPFAGEFDELAGVLADADIIGAGWGLSADKPLDRAAVGFIVCRASGWNGGLNWRLTGLGRYAWRELVYHGIARASSEWNLISGGEFLGILLKTDEYLASIGRASWKRSELGGERAP